MWKWKTSRRISLTIRTKRICSRNELNQEINLVKDYAALNGFPERIVNSIIKQALKSNDSNTTGSNKANVTP